jgi:hypothetical protein
MAKILTRAFVAIAIGTGSMIVHAQLGTVPIRDALPNVSSISPANAAGVLQYCMQHDLVSSAVGSTVIDNLTKAPDVTKSHDFVTGQSGQILASKTFAIGAAPTYLQSEACDMVLKRAQQFK